MRELDDLSLALRGQPVKDKRYELYSLASSILLEEGFYFSQAKGCIGCVDFADKELARTVD